MMYRTRIKMCGTTRVADAEVAVSAGIDCLGFIFAEKSPRYIPPQHAAELTAHLPPFISRVGVFVNETGQKVVETARRAGLTGIQLHGNESPEFCQALRSELGHIFILKAFRVGEQSTKEDFTPYEEVVDGFLLDTYVKDVEGGTGIAFDWGCVGDLDLRRPVILAGGLEPENIEAALNVVKPYAVDVNSGIEISPGKKDESRIRLFARKVAHFDAGKSTEASGQR